jgi:hypothetical protein
MASKKVKAMKEKELSLPAIGVGLAANVGTAAIIGGLMKSIDIPVKGPKKFLIPIATFGISQWIANEAMFAAADESQEYIDAAKAAVTFVTHFQSEMNKIKAAKAAAKDTDIFEEDEDEEEES